VPELRLILPKILSKDKDVRRLFAIQIDALMCFPNEEERAKKEGYLAGLFDRISNGTQWREDSDNTRVSEDKTFKEIRDQAAKDAPAFPDLKKKAVKNFCNGLFAGEILSGIYEFKQSAPKLDIGVRRAIYLLSKYGDYTRQTKMIGGRKVKVHREPPRRPGQRTIEGYWKQFKNVAHFYAALRYFEGTGQKRRLNFEALQPAGIAYFLSVAKQLESFAISYVPPHSDKPLISEVEILVIKTNFSLPPINLNPSPPSTWIKKALKHYKAYPEAY